VELGLNIAQNDTEIYNISLEAEFILIDILKVPEDPCGEKSYKG